MVWEMSSSYLDFFTTLIKSSFFQPTPSGVQFTPRRQVPPPKFLPFDISNLSTTSSLAEIGRNNAKKQDSIDSENLFDDSFNVSIEDGYGYSAQMRPLLMIGKATVLILMLFFTLMF